MKKIILNTIIVFSLLLHMGCAEKRPLTRTPVKDKSPLTIAPRWENAGKPTQWTQHVNAELKRIGSPLLKSVPADIALFCPNYPNLELQQKQSFWVYLLSAMTEKESGHNPSVQYVESFRDRHGNRIVSRGLLQLSIESANGYKCGFNNPQELHDPLRNLSCGIVILSRWVEKDNRIAGKINGKWKGGARYWSVLRDSNQNAYPDIIQWTNNIEFCK